MTERHTNNSSGLHDPDSQGMQMTNGLARQDLGHTHLAFAGTCATFLVLVLLSSLTMTHDPKAERIKA